MVRLLDSQLVRSDSDSKGDGASTPADKVEVALRGTAVILAGLPTTLLIPLPLTQLVTRRFHRETLLKRIHFMVPWARFCTKAILKARVVVHGREHLPGNTKGYLFISNHQSYVDILVLMGALDTVAFLSKSLVRRIPVLGRCAYAGGTVFFERNDPEERQRALEETLQMCEQSTAVVVFPEGTRSPDGNLRDKIHPRAMEEAFWRGLKVIPVALHGTHRIFPKAMDRVRTGQPVSVRIAEPIDPKDFDDAQTFVQTCWDTVRGLHEECRTDLEALLRT